MQQHAAVPWLQVMVCCWCWNTSYSCVPAAEDHCVQVAPLHQPLAGGELERKKDTTQL